MLVLCVDFLSSSGGQYLQSSGDGSYLIQVLIQFLLELVVGVGRLELIASALLPLGAAFRSFLATLAATLRLSEALLDPLSRCRGRSSSVLSIVLLLQVAG